MSDENVPMDVTAEQAAAIVKAALQWRWRQGLDPVLNKEEWRLHEACTAYGDKFKGLRGQ